MISLLEDYLADVDNKSAVSCVKSILKYPLNKGELDFCLAEEDEKVLYDKYFYRIILHVFEKIKQSPNSEILHLAKYITQYSKADVWLECMCALVGQLDASGKDLVVKELERFFSELDRVPDFINACLHNFDVHLECAPAFMESRVRLLCNIPALISNLKRGDCSYFTDESGFVKKVLSAFERVPEISERSCQFMGLAVSCLCMTGYTEHVSDFIIKQSIDNTIHLWSKLLKYVNAKGLEITLSPLAKKCPTSSMYYALISELLETPTGFDAYMRLCRRLFYIRQFRTGNTIRNIFSSFCLAVRKRESQEKSKQLIKQVDENLGLPALSVWSDVSSIQSASLERRIYVSQIFISWFVDFRNMLSSEFTITDDHLLPDILSGISNHLASPRIEVRTLGMVIGDEDQKLKFDYEELEFLKYIRPYFVPMDENHGVESNLQATIPTETISGSDSHEDTVASRDHRLNGEDGTVNQTVHELDSDDDPDSDNDSLKPLPSTQPSSHNDKTPHYLRECLDGMLLTKVEDNKVNVACTLSAEKLIRDHPEAARELALEFANTLVHVEPPVTPDQKEVAHARHKALIAIGVVAPKKCARYLTSQFCQQDNSVGKKMYIISCLTDIACELYGGKEALLSQKLSAKQHVIENDTIQASKVQEGKTRRFFKKRSPPSTFVNKFSHVAGEFFFPLLKSIPNLSLSSVKGTFAHQEAVLLASLLASLGTMYACSRFSPVQNRMADELLDLIPLFYRHPEPAVRRALLIAVGTVITTTPLEILSSRPQLIFRDSLLPYGNNTNSEDNTLSGWLKSCSVSDTDTECQLLASNGLSALCERFLELNRNK
ncbi:unnamed protein product [Trichobilharzia szidati]|nr:unnamed protein product [Trichobilharzia szidati]